MNAARVGRPLRYSVLGLFDAPSHVARWPATRATARSRPPLLTRLDATVNEPTARAPGKVLALTSPLGARACHPISTALDPTPPPPRSADQRIAVRRGPIAFLATAMTDSNEARVRTLSSLSRPGGDAHVR